VVPFDKNKSFEILITVRTDFKGYSRSTYYTICLLYRVDIYLQIGCSSNELDFTQYFDPVAYAFDVNDIMNQLFMKWFWTTLL